MTEGSAARAIALIFDWAENSRIGRIVVCRGDARVLYCNGAARAQLNDNGPLTLREGVLRGDSPEVEEQLQTTLAARSQQYLALNAPFGAGPLMAMIDPVGEDHAVISLWRASRPSAALLAQLAAFCGLSQQQARVAAELAAGCSVEEIARELAISVDTVRSHLKGVYEKTGARSQAEVLAFALRCMAH